MAIEPVEPGKFEEIIKNASASADADKEKTTGILTGGNRGGGSASSGTEPKKNESKTKKRLVLNVSESMYAAVERYSEVSGMSMSGVGCKAIYDFLVANNIQLF